VSEALLKVRGLTLRYGAITAVHGVDLDVETGTIAALIGANGAGKTTILRGLSGLMPVAGSIRFESREIAGDRPHRIARRGIVQVPEGRQLFAGLSVADNLRMGAYLVPSKAEIARRRAGVLDLFPRLAERLDQPAGLMSGGEQQMLAIGRALMADPRLLLLDEPSMGLAPLLVDEIFAIIARLRQQGRTILLIEQNAGTALEVADRAYVLENGRIALSGPAAEIARDPRVIAAYLGAG